ncbi:SDR family NAD(P)-dependent oxidoreductase [Arthrobacter sp. H14]|uniref:SDR family NAD(P)-dependent oxidoreductase n=1 Tax=Arthrobacter sp. H14 TaxID=1312959 RepID=UPI0004BA62A0|nr:SDR family NAD(P)-dependent oxidoreductase [Arthrobacter sp. H14]
MGKLTDKIALITGSDSGIGQATAIEFAKEGADVVVHYLEDADGANATREQVEAQGRRAIVVHGDHGDEATVKEWFRAALEAFGRIDILMNNASVDASGTYVADLEIADFEATMRSNLIGQLICCKHFINHRKQTGGGGKIINITSVHQEQARAGAADYDCSKGALRNLTRTLVLEVSRWG